MLKVASSDGSRSLAFGAGLDSRLKPRDTAGIWRRLRGRCRDPATDPRSGAFNDGLVLRRHTSLYHGA
jgi:hypothetical protein